MTLRPTGTVFVRRPDRQSESFTSSTRRSTGRDGGAETAARPRSAAAAMVAVAVAVETAAAAAAAAVVAR